MDHNLNNHGEEEFRTPPTSWLHHLRRDIHFHAKLLWLAILPIPAGVVSIVASAFVMSLVDEHLAGTSQAAIFLNNSSILSSCEGQAKGAVFRGADMLLVAMMGILHINIHSFTMFVAYRRGAWRRLLINFLVTIGLALASMKYLENHGEIQPSFVVVIAILQFGIPDTLRSLYWKSYRKTFRMFIASFQSGFILVFSGCMIVVFLHSSLGDKQSAGVMFLLLGVFYPSFTLLIRFAFRRMIRKILRGEKKLGSRRSVLKTRQIANESGVTLFTMPGFFCIFLIESHASFFSAILMQMLIETFGAIAFTTMRRKYNSSHSPWSTWSTRRISESARVHAVAKQSSGKLQRQNSGWVEWEGLVVSEEIGEKRALFIGSLLPLYVCKDFQLIAWRFGFSLFAESMSDHLKTRVYVAHGLMGEEIKVSRSWFEILSGVEALSGSTFFCFLGVFFFCWAG